MITELNIATSRHPEWTGGQLEVRFQRETTWKIQTLTVTSIGDAGT